MMDILKSDIYNFNAKNLTDGRNLLSEIKDGTIATAFFDPQYRGVLDKLHYGNEGKSRGRERCSLEQMDDNIIRSFITEINRVLKKSGHLFFWVDKYHLIQDIYKWFSDTNLNVVDMIVWDKGKLGMGYRARHKSEYLVVLQKSPVKAKACWRDHSIPDVWAEKVVKNHPHSKPVELQRRLIAATTADGDVVLDPAAGGYSVFEACKQLDRCFLGCDIRYGVTS